MDLSPPIDLRFTLGLLRRGAGDPCLRMGESRILRASRTADGPVTLLLSPRGSTIDAWAWGPGADWQLEHLPELVGAEDDPKPLMSMLAGSNEPGAQLLRDLGRRFSGLRLPRPLTVTEVLVPVILEQKVLGLEAWRSYRELVRMLGEPAPGPAEIVDGLMVPPAPATLSATPYWAFHGFGIERRRAETIRRACSHAPRLEALSTLPSAVVHERLTSIRGVGAWSAAEVALKALGDPDAVSVGDFHLPHQVAWALTRCRRADDATMLSLLEPYRGQRGRVIRLIEAAGMLPPRHGPRQPVRSIRAI